MYCQNCGTEIPEGGGFCPECGKSVNATVQQTPLRDSVDSKSDAQKANPKPYNPRVTKIVIGVVVAALLLIVAGIALFSLAGKTAEPQGVHIPTIDEIQKKANSIEGGEISFATNYSYDDSYFILMDGESVGKLYLNVNSSECVGIYIEKKQADDADLAYAQVCVGAIEACDPSLGLEGAKEVLSSSLDGDDVERNGVTYAPHFSKDRNILRIAVPGGYEK